MTNSTLILVGRVIVVVAGAVWLGGLTFYAAVVIPTAHDVLGSHREVGFITQQVTERINAIAVVALVTSSRRPPRHGAARPSGSASGLRQHVASWQAHK